MAATLASQGAAAAALAATPLLGLSTSDAYAIGLQIGNASLAGVVIGVVYLLAVGRPWFDQWRRWAVIAAGFSIALPLVVIGANAVSRHTSDSLFVRGEVALIFGLGGAALAIAGVGAVRMACQGSPMWLASLTIAPNVSMLIATLIAWRVDRSGLSLAPAIAWAATCGALATFGSRSGARDASDGVAPDADSQGLQATALAAGVITSSVFPSLYITAISGIRAGAATALFLVTKVGSSFVGITVNSVLLVRYNWASERRVTGRSSLILTSAAAVAAGIALLLHTSGFRGASYGVAIVWWLCPLVAAPLILREVNARRMARTVMAKAAADMIVSAGTVAVLFAHPSFTGYLAAFAISQAVTMTVGGVGLRNRPLVAASLVLLVVSEILLVRGW
ncbi:hypothetical protein [Nocardioides baekrokdamisoli]|nr:hypothetical protein [Nocardioides baekrokdamisoli]